MTTARDLLNLLELEQLEMNIFNGESKTVGSPVVFGGQVLAQAINAANRTVSATRNLHSLHAYFLEAGNLELPITYTVNIVRDGGSFSVRRVTASQEGSTIFILAASFHKKEFGYDHQIQMKTNIKPPEELLSWTDMLKEWGDFLPKNIKTFFEIDRPIEFKPTFVNNPFDRKNIPPYSDVWFKLKGEIGELNLATKQQILTYISDYNLLASALNPHASTAHFGNTQSASLDHSIWFFRDFDFSDWLLFSMESPSAKDARGFARGNIFTRSGKLIASVAQEGLLRPVNNKKNG